MRFITQLINLLVCVVLLFFFDGVLERITGLSLLRLFGLR